MKILFLSSLFLLSGCATSYVNTCHIGPAITINYKLKVDALAETQLIRDKLTKDGIIDGGEALWCEHPVKEYKK
jgi:hypothetical protein